MWAKKTEVSEDMSEKIKTPYNFNEHICILFWNEIYLRKNTMLFPLRVSFKIGGAISKLSGEFFQNT